MVPFVDDRVKAGAEKAGIPLSAIAGPPEHVAHLCAALARLTPAA